MKKRLLIGTLIVVFALTTGIASARVYFSFGFPPFAIGFGGPAVVAPPPAYPYPYGGYYSYPSYPYAYGYGYPGYYGYGAWAPGYRSYGRGGRTWVPGYRGYRR